MKKAVLALSLALASSSLLFAGSTPDSLDMVQLHTLAVNGSPYYQAVLSTACRNGDLTAAPDYVTAANWAISSSDAGNPLGLYAYAALLDSGLGVQKDKDKAEELFAKAAPSLKEMAEKGDFRACYSYAYLLYSGRGGVKEDKAQAATLFKQSAEAGDPHAAYMTGLLFQRGEGVERSAPKAIEWFQKAALSGERKAQLALGTMYLKGGTFGRNMEEAAKWILMSAEAGEPDAQYLAGVMYETGSAGKKDMSKALQYYHRAALQGDEKAKKRLKAFAGEMRKTLGLEEPAPDSASKNENK